MNLGTFGVFKGSEMCVKLICGAPYCQELERITGAWRLGVSLWACSGARTSHVPTQRSRRRGGETQIRVLLRQEMDTRNISGDTVFCRSNNFNWRTIGISVILRIA